MRVLIMRLGAMGDILHALPAVAALRQAHPEWYLGWAVEPRWSPLLRADDGKMPLVNCIHLVKAKDWARSPLQTGTLREIGALRRGLRAERYDQCIDLQGAVRSAVAGRLAGASRMSGEDQPREWAARWLFGERVRTHGVHVIEQALEVCSAASSEPRRGTVDRWSAARCRPAPGGSAKPGCGLGRKVLDSRAIRTGGKA